MASFQTPLSLPSAQRDDNSGYRCASKTEPRPRLRRLDLRDRHRHWADYGPHYLALATTVWASLIGVVGFGATIGSMLPFALRRIGFDPATSSAPFVATLVDVTGLIIYFTIASVILRGLVL